MRKTKIICTMGPATDNDNTLRDLMLAGMDVARLNFSHGTHEQAKERIDRIKRIREELDIPVAIMLDTKGPEIRLKSFKNGKVTVKEGDKFTLYTDDVEGDETGVSITYKNLAKDITVGTRLLIDDGLIEIEAQSVKPDRIICEVKSGGELSDSKGVNVPNVSLSMPYMSQKDIDDIIFGIEQDVDFIAASFVRTPNDVLQIRSLLEKNGNTDIRIISKIENSEGVNNIDDIIKESNGVMIARGDMGVEIPLELLPRYQKEIIKKVYGVGKQGITATQMLDSMMQYPSPTRAEANDVANAVYDGTSAVMLSGETASGKYPLECIRTMVKIAGRTEQDIDYRKRFLQNKVPIEGSITNAISKATVNAAMELNAKAIVTVTESGRTAYMISRYRPFCPVIACTSKEQTYRQLSLSWGIIPLLIEEKEELSELFGEAIKAVERAAYAAEGDVIVLTAGVPLGTSGTTNLLKVHCIGTQEI